MTKETPPKSPTPATTTKPEECQLFPEAAPRVFRRQNGTGEGSVLCVLCACYFIRIYAPKLMQLRHAWETCGVIWSKGSGWLRAKPTEQAHGINILVDFLTGSMWTAGLIEYGPEGKIRVGKRADFGASSVLWTSSCAQMSCRIDPWAGIQAHIFWLPFESHICSWSSIHAFFLSVQCLLKWSKLAQTTLPTTSGHSCGWVAKACFLNTFLLSSNILISA